MNYFELSDAQLNSAGLSFLQDPRVQALLLVLSIWALIWKGIALWKASQNGSKPWFIALLVLNTVGILEIVYIFYFSKKKNKPTV